MNIIKLDGNKCRVWGCGCIYELEKHHIIPRGQQGPNEPWNLITLCNKHHSLVTENKMSMIDILNKLKNKVDYRWGKSYDWLVKRSELRKI